MPAEEEGGTSRVYFPMGGEGGIDMPPPTLGRSRCGSRVSWEPAVCRRRRHLASSGFRGPACLCARAPFSALPSNFGRNCSMRLQHGSGDTEPVTGSRLSFLPPNTTEEGTGKFLKSPGPRGASQKQDKHILF